MPAFGALIAEPLFLFADSVIVGRLGTAPLGGLGMTSQALTTLVGISIFLAYGTTAAVARQIGAGHREAAIRQGIDGLWLAGIIGTVVLAGGWPVAGVVFVLDGVLIGAGDQDYLALAGEAAAGVFTAGAALVIAEHAGLVALWLAFSLWLLARFVTLTLRARSSQWLVTGAVRRYRAAPRGSGPRGAHREGNRAAVFR